MPEILLKNYGELALLAPKGQNFKSKNAVWST